MPRMTARPWVFAGLLLVCALVLWAELFGPKFIGIASNGDLGKVSGWLCLSAPDGSDSNFLYFAAKMTALAAV